MARRKRSAFQKDLDEFTSASYRVSRAANTLRAASRGPVAFEKRQIRKQVYKREGTFTRQVLRSMGLLPSGSG